MSDEYQVIFVLVLTLTPFPGITYVAVKFMKTKYRTVFIMLFIWCYMMLPLPILMKEKKLTALDAAYWGFQSLTTVGYGDIEMDTGYLKLFATFYTSFGMIGGFFVKLLFLERAYRRLHRGKKEKWARAKDLGVAGSALTVTLVLGTAYWGPRFRELGEPGSRVVNGFYFTVTTISTIGFGDLVPVGPTDCIIFGLLVVLGVPCWFYFMGCIAGYLVFAVGKHFRYNESEVVSMWQRLKLFRSASVAESDGDVSEGFTDDAFEKKLEEERKNMSLLDMPSLVRQALDNGASAEEIVIVFDHKNPKDAIINLIISQERVMLTRSLTRANATTATLGTNATAATLDSSDESAVVIGNTQRNAMRSHISIETQCELLAAADCQEIIKDLREEFKEDGNGNKRRAVVCIDEGMPGLSCYNNGYAQHDRDVPKSGKRVTLDLEAVRLEEKEAAI